MNGMATSHRKAHNLNRWQLGLVTGTVIILAGALLAASAASSYDNLWHLAAAHRVPMPRLNPLELDGGLVVITLVDIVFTWIGHPSAWLRFLARLLGIGTIAANVAAGWPDPVGAFDRAFAPVIIVALTEAVRSLLLRRNEDVQRERARKAGERIPRIRWLLDPGGTVAIWKRMRLWNERSYPKAIGMELERLVAIEKLSARYPQGWRQSAPAHLVLMLTRGVRMADALAMVAELTAPEPVPVAVLPGGPSGRSKPAVTGGPKPRRTAPKTAPADDLALEAKALELLAADLTMSGAALARALGVSESYGRKLRRRLTQPDRPAVAPQDRPSRRARTAPQDRSGDR